MKKMICEVCNSQKIKKENGIFVCQDCGMEYSLEEVKNLLKEVEEDIRFDVVNEPVFSNTITKNDDDKYLLLDNLINWLDIIMSFDGIHFWLIDFPNTEYLTDEVKYNSFKFRINNFEAKTFAPLTGTKLISNMVSVDFDSDLKQSIMFKNIFVFKGKTFLNLILNNEKLNKGNKYLLDHSYESVYANGQGPFFKYGLYLDGNTKQGIAFEKVANNLKMWWDLLLTRKSKSIFAGRTDVKKGLFGDKVTTVDIKSEFDINQFLTTYDYELGEMIRHYNAVTKYYTANCEEAIQNYKELLESADEMEQKFFIPHKYRKKEVLITLIEYIKDGRVDNWKEAVNLLMTEDFQKAALANLCNINQKLDDIRLVIEREMSKMNKTLSDISYKITDTNYKLFQCNNSLRKIMKDTRLNLLCNI